MKELAEKGDNLKYASKIHMNDKDVVQIAVTQNGNSLQ